jgi:diguanylate cyclase (GGDEF)-like protein
LEIFVAEKLIGIGATARMCGLSERTLRYWESLGLILPTRMPSGHRKFSKGMVKKIIALKETLDKNNLRINDLVTSSGFLQDEGLKSKVRDLSAFNIKAQMESFYQDAKKNMRLHPITSLPDHFFIQQEIERRLEEGGKIAGIYVDLENFRRFNQKYGYARGDKVLKFLAMLLFEKTSDFGNPVDFVGHLGSDDFIILTTPERYRQICGEVIKSFDRLVLQYYDKEDREATQIRIPTRKGEEMQFPIMAITMSVVTNERRDLSHFVQINDIANELKQYASTFKRSEMVVDRRSN